MNELMDKVNNFTIEEIFPGKLGDNIRKLNVKKPEDSLRDRIDAVQDTIYTLKSMLIDLDTEIMRLHNAIENVLKRQGGI